MEASALKAPAGLARPRLALSPPLLRLRSDEQLVSLFRRGHDDAFRVIHDRYRARLFAYARQMLPGPRQDAEDALQDVFVRAYRALRESDRDVSLRAWLYRVAHNRCVDELRRPPPPSPDVLEIVRPPSDDPLAQAERRESLRRLVHDVRRLPEHQRSALLMRELNGLGYTEIAEALGVTVPAVKSLLVRARVSLAQAGEARDVACVEVQGALALAHDRGVRPSGLVRRHLSECGGCATYRRELRGVSRSMASLLPAVGPLAALARACGLGGAGGGAALGSGGAMSSGMVAAGTAKVAAVVCVAVVTAGGAVEVGKTLTQAESHHRTTGPTNNVDRAHRAPEAGRPALPLPSSAAPAPAGPAQAAQRAGGVTHRAHSGRHASPPSAHTGLTARPGPPAGDPASSAPTAPSVPAGPASGTPGASAPTPDPPTGGPSVTGTAPSTAGGAQAASTPPADPVGVGAP